MTAQQTPRVIAIGPFYHSASNSVTAGVANTDCVTDDVMLLLVASKGTAVGTPSGWTFIRKEVTYGTGPNAVTLWAFWRRVTSPYTTGVPNVTVTDTSISMGIGARVIVLRDVDLSQPIDGSNGYGSVPDPYASYVNTSQVTVVTPNSLLLSVIGFGYEIYSPDVNNVDPWLSMGAAPNTATNIVEIFDTVVGSPEYQYAIGMAAATAVAPTVGSYGIDGIADSSPPVSTMILAFRPATVVGPRFVGKGTFTKFIDQVNNVPWPAGHQVDDLGLMVVQSDSRVQIPAGWTQVFSTVGVGCYTYLFYRWATTTAMPDTTVYSWVVTPGVFNAIMCQVYAFRNVSKTAPFSAYATAWNASQITSATCPDVSTPNSYNGVFSIVGIPTNQTDLINWASWSGGQISSTQQSVRALFDYSWFSGDGGGGFATWFAQQALSGTVGGLNAVMDDPDYYTRQTVVLALGTAPFGGTASVTATAQATLVVPLLLAAAVAVTAAVTTANLRVIETAAVEVFANFGGTLSAPALTQAPLTTEIALVAAATAAATPSASLYAGTNYYADLTAAATASAELATAIRFAGSGVTAPVVIDAPLTTSITPAASVALSAVASAPFITTEITMSASPSVSATAEGLRLVDSTEYRADIFTLMTATGDLATGIEMAGTSAPTVTSTPALGTAITFAAVADAIASSATGALDSAILLSGSSATSTVLVASLDTGLYMAAELLPSAAINGTLTTFKLMSAAVAAAVTASAAELRTFVAFTGQLNASVTALGTLASFLVPGDIDEESGAIVRVPGQGWLIHIPPQAGVIQVPQRSRAAAIEMEV